MIKLKGQQPTKDDRIPLDDLGTILSFLSDKFGVFQFDTKSEKACYLGRLKSIDSKNLIIDFFDTNGKWNGQRRFKPDTIRTIEFDNDYINSLKLLSKKQFNTKQSEVSSTKNGM